MEWGNVPALVVFFACVQVGFSEEFSENKNESEKRESDKLRGPTVTEKRNFYDLTARDIDGNVRRFEEYRGQVLLVVNVASECGFTDKHYKGLVRLQEHYGSSGKFSVIGIPCNDFGGQEPGSDPEIKEFVTTKYQLNFPLYSKASITGKPASPVYKFLIEASNTEPNWNFWKYLVSHQGDVLAAWGPWIDIEAITSTIRTAVNTAVMADPNKPNQQASGPPKPQQKDYGDGAGGKGKEPAGEGGRPSVNHRPAGNDEPQRAGATLVHEDL